MSQVSQEWTKAAEELGDAMMELGAAAGHLFACAWRARVDLDALGALAGAATALGQERLQLRLRGEVLPSDRELRERAEDLEADAGDLWRTACQMRTDATSAWSAACRDLHAARTAMNDAKSGEARGQAQHAAAEANARIADCEVALEILGDIIGRVAWAIGCFQRVPDDLATHYEAAYALKRRNIDLPADGDFLTGTPATPADPRHAMSQ